MAKRIALKTASSSVDLSNLCRSVTFSANTPESTFPASVARVPTSSWPALPQSVTCEFYGSYGTIVRRRCTRSRHPHVVAFAWRPDWNGPDQRDEPSLGKRPDPHLLAWSHTGGRGHVQRGVHRR
jgi:hypothetical protein